MNGTDPAGDCTFCAVVRGEDAAAVVLWRSEHLLALFPTDPATPGHTMVITRRHVADVWELPHALGHAVMDAAIGVGRAIRAALSPDGLNLISSSGTA